MASTPRTAVKAKASKPVEALKHKDKRVNIPTEELREFVRAEEEDPEMMLCPPDFPCPQPMSPIRWQRA